MGPVNDLNRVHHFEQNSGDGRSKQPSILQIHIYFHCLLLEQAGA